MSEAENRAGNEQDRAGSGEPTWRDRVDQFERKLREQIKDVEESIREGVRNIVPPDAAAHLSNSKREFLMAIRTVIDNEIKRADAPKSEGAQAETTKPGNQE